MMNLTKFGTLNLDTPRSRYEFLKHVFKSMKKKENQGTHRLTDGARSSAKQRMGTEVDRR